MKVINPFTEAEARYSDYGNTRLTFAIVGIFATVFSVLALWVGSLVVLFTGEVEIAWFAVGTFFIPFSPLALLTLDFERESL